MNKNVISNVIAAMICVAGYASDSPVLLSVGLFSLSGALTNWLAIHMLFERIPGLYGSGVVVLHFEEFKGGIRRLMMNQFFTRENIQRFLSGAGSGAGLDLVPIIEKTDLSPAFDGLVKVIENSSFGGMLSMVGGAEALQPMREPFTAKMKSTLASIAATDEFKASLQEGLSDSGQSEQMLEKIEQIIEQRLDELTPQAVKEIVQAMMREHLGWLVVWGAVFGGLIGFICALL